MMSIIDRIIAAVAPQWAASRAQARTVLMHYDAARRDRRMSSVRPDASDADAAARARKRLAFVARDMIRNTPFASRIQQVVTGNVVGDGIIPKVMVAAGTPDRSAALIREAGLQRVERLLDTAAIDYHGRCNFYGIQRLAMNTIVDSGEVLIRRHRRPFQVEVLEPDYIDDTRFSVLPDGGEIVDGIEYDRDGRRVAYWLYPVHPGSDWSPGARIGVSQRVPAADILHVYRVDRPGQRRGVSWLANVAMRLQDLGDHEDAQLMRQKIAACFAAFRKLGPDSSVPSASVGGTLAPGVIQDLADGEEITFAVPPGVEGYDEFTRSVLRSVAAGVGITYEALTGDLSSVNFSSARLGHLQMERNISSWQWLMMVPQFLQPFSRWFVEAWADDDATGLGRDPELLEKVWLSWVPPHRILVDPAREMAALREAVRSGFASRQSVVRQLGLDPERLLSEIAQDRDEADKLGLPFDSDPRADVSRRAAEESKQEDGER